MQNSWSAYWTMAVHSFNRLAEYSRLVCCGDQQGAGQVWHELRSSMIPETLAQKMRALRDDLARLSEHCCDPEGVANRDVRDLVRSAGRTLEALREMVDEGSLSEWAEVTALLRSSVGNIEPELPATKMVTLAPPAVSRAVEAHLGSGSDESSAMGAAVPEGGAAYTMAEVGVGDFTPEGDAAALHDTPRCNVPQSVAPTATPPVAEPRATAAEEWPAANMPRGAPMELEERDIEALQILRQVESEVRALKQWYQEAIEAIRASSEPTTGTVAAPARRRSDPQVRLMEPLDA